MEQSHLFRIDFFYWNQQISRKRLKREWREGDEKGWCDRKDTRARMRCGRPSSWKKKRSRWPREKETEWRTCSSWITLNTICQLHTIYKPFQLCVLSAFKMEAALVLQLMILINQYQPEILWILTQSVYYTELNTVYWWSTGKLWVLNSQQQFTKSRFPQLGSANSMSHVNLI